MTNDHSSESIQEYEDIKSLISKGRDPQRLFRAALTFYKARLEQGLTLKKVLQVKSGIFKGLILKAHIKSSSLYAKIQGSYEKELQRIIERNAIGIDCFLNIGCADGFYLTGIAYWLKVKCIGIDIDPYFESIIKELSIKNKIQNFVTYCTNIESALRECRGKVMILIDVDGNEKDVIFSLNKAILYKKEITEIILFIESDFDNTGQENTSAILEQLILSGYQVKEIEQQSNAYRFNESLPEITFSTGSKLSFIDKAVLGTESRRGGQCWIMATKNI